MDWDKEIPSKFHFLPKMGEEATFHIKTIRKVESANPKLNFTSKVVVLDAQGQPLIDPADGKPVMKDRSMGYHYECELAGDQEGQILSITNFASLRQVFQKFDIQEGDKVLIKHAGKGEWEVVKL